MSFYYSVDQKHREETKNCHDDKRRKQCSTRKEQPGSQPQGGHHGGHATAQLRAQVNETDTLTKTEPKRKGVNKVID